MRSASLDMQCIFAKTIPSKDIYSRSLEHPPTHALASYPHARVFLVTPRHKSDGLLAMRCRISRIVVFEKDDGAAISRCR
eukprot:scaffold83909_cov29-Tisochrysis_lutea.AAC.2